MACRRSAVRSR